MIRSNNRAMASGPSGPSAATPRTCAITCFSRSGWWASRPRSFFILPISHATRARSFSSRTSTSSTRSMLSRKSSSVGLDFQPPPVLFDARNQLCRRAFLGNHRDERAADDRGVGVDADLGDVLGTRYAETEGDWQRGVRADPPHHLAGRGRYLVARTGHAEP